MKQLLYLLFVCYSILGAQDKISDNDIVGLWQVGSTEVAAALLNVYRFYGDKTFEFQISGFDYLSKLYSFSGTYKIHNNELVLTIKKVKEIVDGELEIFGGSEMNMGYFNYKIIERDYTGVQEVKAPLSVDTDKKGYTVLSINFEKFYKISNNPDDEK